MSRKRILITTVVLVAGLVLLYAAHVAAHADFVFVNGQSKPIELRYHDTSHTKGCGTLQPEEECEVVQVGDQSHYCWQYADQGGRNCDPVEDGCPVDPGRIVVDTDDCRYDPDE